MIEIDTKQVGQYETDLKHFARRAFPFATKATINTAAWETRTAYQALIREDLTLRNKWTEKSVQVEQARTLAVSRQEAIVGSMADYMETQEFGGMVSGGRGDKPIATSYSAGQGRDVQPRTHLPRKANWMKRINLKRHGRPGMSRAQRNKVAVLMAVKSGDKYVYMDLGKRDGIFKVTGSKRKPRINMVWDLSRRSVRVPRQPMLGPATNETAQRLPQFYAEALVFQLKRARAFGYR